MKSINSTLAVLALRALVPALALLAFGCARDRASDRFALVSGPNSLPKAPAFLAGPAGVLLTNSGSFSARVEMAYAPASKRKPVSGQLVARGSQMFFDPGDKPGKKNGASVFGFIWDVGTGKGFILSESLQGYAPIASTNRFTHSEVQGAQPVSEKLDSHTVERTTISASGTDGTQSKFEISRASDLGGLAIRIASIDDPSPTTIKLSQVRLETVPDRLFQPPDGFTAYPTEDAMINELTLRERGGRRGGGDLAYPVRRNGDPMEHPAIRP